jgi:hypothetical protein
MGLLYLIIIIIIIIYGYGLLVYEFLDHTKRSATVGRAPLAETST